MYVYGCTICICIYYVCVYVYVYVYQVWGGSCGIFKKIVLSAPNVQTETSYLFLMYLFIKLRILNDNWWRGIWIENTIFTVWLFIGVMIFSLPLAMIYGKVLIQKTVGREKGLYIIKGKACIPWHSYLFLLVDFMSTVLYICIHICSCNLYYLYIYIDLLFRRFAIFMCNIFIVCHQ